MPWNLLLNIGGKVFGEWNKNRKEKTEKKEKNNRPDAYGKNKIKTY